MFCLSVLVAAGVTGLCLGTSLPEPQPQEPLCPLQHSCSSRGTSGDSLVGCSCDAACRIYGDCCLDSEYYNEAEQTRNMDEYKCVGDPTKGIAGPHVYMRHKCSKNWNNAEVEAFCLKGNTLPDHTKVLPVTSTATSRTYVNHYCAICNGEDPASLRTWYTYVVCSSVPDSLIYDEDRGTARNSDYAIVYKDGGWGIIQHGSGDSSFRACEFMPKMPGDIKRYTRQCLPALTCSDSESEREKTLCKSYTAPVYRGFYRYRNKHCASCNGITKYHCELPELPIGNPYIPLAMILDFTDHSGNNRVGFTSPCGTGQVWDMHMKKCRRVFCPRSGVKVSYSTCIRA